MTLAAFSIRDKSVQFPPTGAFRIRREPGICLFLESEGCYKMIISSQVNQAILGFNWFAAHAKDCLTMGRLLALSSCAFEIRRVQETDKLN